MITVYVDGYQLPYIRRPLIAILPLATLLLLMVHSMSVATQAVGELQPRFGQTLVAVHQAESAGATSTEVAELVTLLNRALDLNSEALKLTSPSDARRQAELLAQVDEILASVKAKAVQLQAVASQRTFSNTILTYAFGTVAALVGTIAFAYGVSFWRRYRVKRTFQMKISPK